MKNNIKERIERLLVLAQSPNEHETRAALLKARELMGKYKLMEVQNFVPQSSNML